MKLPPLSLLLHWIQIAIGFYNLYIQNALPFGPIGLTNNTAVTAPATELHVSGSSELKVNADRAVISVKASSEGLKQAKVADEIQSSHNEVMGMLRPLTAEGLLPNGSQTTENINPAIVGLRVNTFKADTRRKTPSFWGGDKPVYEASVEFEAEFADFQALGQVVAKLTRTKRIQIRWLKWMLKEETRAQAISKCQQDVGYKLYTKVKDFVEPMGLHHARPIQIWEKGVIHEKSMVKTMSSHDFVTHDEEDGLFATTEASLKSSKSQEVHDFEPREIEIRSDLEATFEAW